MADSTIKVKIKWGAKKTTKSIKIDAKTLEGALDKLSRLPEWGKFEGQIGYQYKADKNKRVTEVTLKPSYEIKMPVWTKYGAASKESKKEWDRMYKALAKHEDGHRLIHLEALAKINAWLTGAEGLSVNEFKSTFEKMMKDGQKNQDKFDSSTDHGAKKGVHLHIAA
ncbi:MAG: DUF922 domain-containing protein [Phycisphaerales bacterium JB040]